MSRESATITGSTFPLETQRFVFRILAIKRIIEAPQQHGFTLSSDEYYAPETFSTIQVDAFADLPLRLIADAAGTDFKTIKDFNPELRGILSGSRDAQDQYTRPW